MRVLDQDPDVAIGLVETEDKIFSTISVVEDRKEGFMQSVLAAPVPPAGIVLGKILGGTPPIMAEGIETYSNPLPHVLILTAIVVGVATLALGLAITVRIHEAYGTIEEDEITHQVDREDYAE